MKKENLFSSVCTFLLTPIIIIAAIVLSPVVKKRKEDLSKQINSNKKQD